MVNQDNLTMKAFIPFVQASVKVLEELTSSVFEKKNIYPFVGNISNGYIKVEIGVVGDIQTRTVFDLPKDFIYKLSAVIMGMENPEDVDEELAKETAQELGNMISGSALGFLEELQISCDITPPIVHTNEKIFSNTTKSGVIEFTDSTIGNFFLYMVIQESTNQENFALNALVLNFDMQTDHNLARFLFPRGVCVIHTQTDNLVERIKNYDPTIIILNSDTEDIEAQIQILNSSENTEKIYFISFGDYKPELTGTFKAISINEKTDVSNITEQIRKIARDIELNIFIKRKRMSFDIASDLQPYMLVKTTNGDNERIPVKSIGMYDFTLDVSAHTDITYPEGKNLKDITLDFGIEKLPINQSQIGKTNIEKNEVMIYMKHILDTDLKILTSFLYKLISGY